MKEGLPALKSIKVLQGAIWVKVVYPDPEGSSPSGVVGIHILL